LHYAIRIELPLALTPTMTYHFVALAAGLVAAVRAGAPEQIHVAYTGIAGQLSLDFVSTYPTASVSFGSKSVNTTSFNYPEIGYVHQALLDYTGIAPGTAASYAITTANGTTSPFAVTPIVPAGSERFAVLGDFGTVNDECLNDLVKQAAAGAFDSVLHVGDFAYDFESLFSINGNSFMNQIQPYASVKPVMPVEGNHEACIFCPKINELEPYSAGNFTQYKARFHSVSLNAGKNSGTNNNRYYSFNVGITHYIVFSGEAYLYAHSPVFTANQLAFMKADLAAVDRTVTPWVVALVHKDFSMWSAEAEADFSPLLEAAGVDVLFCGHVHYYNRYLPYNPITKDTDTQCASADLSTYTNPRHMVTIVSGAPGDIEGDDSCAGTDARPSVACTENYGWGIWQPLNATHATWAFHTVVADNGPADFKDALTIVQATHGPRTV